MKRNYFIESLTLTMESLSNITMESPMNRWNGMVLKRFIFSDCPDLVLLLLKISRTQPYGLTREKRHFRRKII